MINDYQMMVLYPVRSAKQTQFVGDALTFPAQLFLGGETMKKLKWWFLIVGGFYFLLSLANLYGIFVDHAFFASALPYPADAAVVQAFVDGWSPFGFEVLGLGTFMLWAARKPAKYIGAVWLIIWLELLHGVIDDIYLIARGFDATQYIAFIAIHLAIIVTGYMFARQATAELEAGS